MSGLAALLAGHTAADVYRWHGALPAPDVQHAVEHAGWTFRHLDGWTVEDRDAFLKELGAALGTTVAPSDLDDLAAVVADLPAEGEGTVLLWDGWSPLARHDDATFRAAIDAFAARARNSHGGRFAVILRGDGPDLELEELPHKH